jgi:hypothetical protein
VLALYKKLVEQHPDVEMFAFDYEEDRNGQFIYKQSPSIIPEIKKKIDNIKPELIELTIDNTQKYIKEKSFGFSKSRKQNTEKKEDKKDKDKKNQNQELVFEDLPYEKEIKDHIEKEKKHRDAMLKKKESVEAISKIQKRKFLNTTNTNNSQKKSSGNNNVINNQNISDDLSMIDDLSLSYNGDFLAKKNNTLNRVNSYLIDFDNNSNNLSNNLSNVSNENDLTNKSLISHNDEDPIKIKTIRLKERDNLFSKVEFNKPYSILTSIIDLQKDREIQYKLDKMRKNFKLDHFLEKEKKRGVDVDGLGRRKSFLKFIKYTQKKTNLNDYLKDLDKDKPKIEMKDEELEKNNKMKAIFELINENKKEENDKSNLDMSEFDNINKKDFDTKSKLE